MSITCSKGQFVDRNKCYNHWPQFPCYDPRMRACHSEDGVQLFDPVSDMWDGVSTAYLAVLDFAEHLLRGKKGTKDPEMDRRIKETLNTWGPAFVGGPRPLMMSGDPVLATTNPLIRAAEQNPIGRYYTAQDIEEIAESIPEHARTVRDRLVRIKNTLVGEQQKQQASPPRLRRESSDGRGHRITRRKMKSVCSFCKTICKKRRKKKRKEKARRKKKR